jgi:hypothetical protein
MKMFGVLDLETQMEGCRFAIGIRNSHDKSLRLGLTAGLRVFVCSNMVFSGGFTPVLAKHTKSFNLVDTLSVGVDRIQRNFEPMQRQVESWRQTQITDARAKLIFYSAFVEGKLDAPKSLLPEVHRLYFEPQDPEFSARTMWSLYNAFTSAFKELEPVRSSRRRRSWASSYRLSSRRPFSDEWRYWPDRRSFTTPFCAPGVADGFAESLIFHKPHFRPIPRSLSNQKYGSRMQIRMLQKTESGPGDAARTIGIPSESEFVVSDSAHILQPCILRRGFSASPYLKLHRSCCRVDVRIVVLVHA